MKRSYYRIRRFSVIIIGLLFLFSGIFKLMDIVGSTLIVEAYLNFFKLYFLLDFSKDLAFILSFIESFTGIGLIIGVWKRIFAYLSISLLSFFTLITFVLVVFDPPMSCGCFGEFISLTHTQTFIKNIILGIFAIVAFSPLPSIKNTKKSRYFSFCLLIVWLLVFAIYSLIYNPLIDYTAYSQGKELITDSLYVEQTIRFDYHFIYQKDGKEESFSLNNIPDSTWSFVRSEVEEIKDETLKENIILPFSNEAGEYRDYLLSTGNSIVISIYEIDKFNREDLYKVIKLINESERNRFKVFVLSATKIQDVEKHLIQIVKNNKEDKKLMSFFLEHLYFSDYKALISLNRSNGGLTWFSDSILIKKWSFNNYPNFSELSECSKSIAIEEMILSRTRNKRIFHSYLLVAFILIFFV